MPMGCQWLPQRANALARGTRGGREVAREIDPAKSFRQLPPDSHESSVETAGDPPAALPEIDCSLCSSYAPTIIHRVQPYFMQCTFVQYEIKQAMWLPDCTSTPFIIGSEVDVSCVLVLIQPAPWSKNRNTRNVYLRTDDKRCRPT